MSHAVVLLLRHMELPEHSSERVIKYFGDPHVSYAANHNI